MIVSSVVVDPERQGALTPQREREGGGLIPVTARGLGSLGICSISGSGRKPAFHRSGSSSALDTTTARKADGNDLIGLAIVEMGRDALAEECRLEGHQMSLSESAAACRDALAEECRLEATNGGSPVTPSTRSRRLGGGMQVGGWATVAL
jgi:hypothetical protein